MDTHIVILVAGLASAATAVLAWLSKRVIRLNCAQG